MIDNPVILLSYVNTKLRDFYKDLDDFCDKEDISKIELIEKLDSINYAYDSKLNQFIRKE